MGCCGVLLCDLILIILTICSITGPALAVTLLKAEFNQTVTLPCERKCSGLGQWTVSHIPHDPLAECNQILCSSQEGFEMSYDQYLKGDLTLSITAADYSKRTTYTCWCDGKVMGDVRLSIEPLISSFRKHPGEDLLLDLSITDPTELIDNSGESGGSSGHRICMVEEAVLRCIAEYEQRASLNHSIINLREVTPSDSGVYIIQDMKYNDIIHMYTITVEEVQPSKAQDNKISVPPWMIGLSVVMVLVLVGVLLLFFVVVHRCLTKKYLRRYQEHKHRAESEQKLNSSKQSGVTTEEETAFLHEPDGAARTRMPKSDKINGERAQKLNSSVSVEDHQSSGGPECRSSLRRSYSSEYLSDFLYHIHQLDPLLKQHSNGDQFCPNGDCTIEIKQLQRDINIIEKQRLSMNGTADMEQLKKERDRLDKIEEYCRKKKKELDNLIHQDSTGAAKGHKRRNSEDCGHVFSSEE